MLMPDLEAGQAAGAPLSLLGSLRGLEDGELLQLYSYPAEHRGIWVRANFIASVDGGATVKGTTSGLGGPNDRLLFSLLRELADVILVGAGTVRIESYAGAHPSVAQRQHRQTRGQSEVPQLAIVTKSGRLDRDMPVFTRTEVPPLVLTCTAAADETRNRLAGLADVIDCSGDDPGAVDEAAVLAGLEDRGLRRVLTEGGPMLLSSFVDRDLLDELCLTIAPCVVGGRARRITTGPGEVLTRMRCAHVLTDEAGYLYTRYLKVGQSET
jgi:riboflavin biosynthesis pyrimidine reductase